MKGGIGGERRPKDRVTLLFVSRKYHDNNLSALGVVYIRGLRLGTPQIQI